MQKSKCNNVVFVRDNFANLKDIVKKHFKNKKISGVVMDLGLSSFQLDDQKRGFSFKNDAPLDMAFAGEKNHNGTWTSEIVNQWSEDDLIKILKEYGEEKFAKRIAGRIVKRRKENPIKTTKELVEIIESAVPAFYRRDKKIHFATRTFQALRIATNDELQSLKQALESALEILEIGGRISVVSFHSLEDRIVKNFFREQARECICPKETPICICNHKPKLKIITKKPILPSESEVDKNPRSRSAKLRVAEKL